MLTKLLKYEFKATGRVFLPLFISLLVFAVITKIFSAFSPQQWETPATISMIIYVIIMAGIFVMTFIMMIQRFYKNLLSDEGYLMFTLPVKPWKHIISKLVASMFWVLASVVIALISIMIIAFGKGDFTEMIKGFAGFHQQVIELLGLSAYSFAFEGILAMLLTLVAGILIIYASIAIGHLVNQHKMLASFGAFLGLNILTHIFFMIITIIPGTDYFANVYITPHNLVEMQSYVHLGMIYLLIILGVLSAAYFTVANFIISKRLNLE